MLSVLEKGLSALFFEDIFNAKNYPDISLSLLIIWKKVKSAARVSQSE